MPVLGLKRFDFKFYSTVSDRYLYLPMLGIGPIVAALLERSHRAGWLLATIALLAPAWRTHDQTRVWRSSEQLFEHTLTVNPKSWSSAHNLATMALLQQRFPGAVVLATRALRAGGDNWQIRLVLAQALERQRRLDEAIPHFEWVVQRRPDLLQPRVLLASAYLQRRRIDEGSSN